MHIRAIILPGFILSLLIISLVLSSCLEELEKIDKIGKTELAPWIDLPIVYSTFSAEEFLTEGDSGAMIFADPQGLLVLGFDDSLSTPPATDFFTLPDQQGPTLSISGPEVILPPVPGSEFTVTKSITFAFSTGQSESLDSIWVKAGQMVVEAISNFQANIFLSLSIPTFKKTGVIYTQDITLNGPTTDIQSVNLQGYTFDLTPANSVSFSITATITNTGQPIGPADELRLTFNLNSTKFSALFGELGTRQVQVAADSIDFDIFDNITVKNFELLSPVITLTARNSFGLPVGFDIQGFSAIKSDNTVVLLSGQATSPPLNPYLFTAPTYAQIGQSTTSVITLNATNSNLGQLIGALPKRLVYQFDAQLNPGGANTKNFVLDTSKMDIAIHAEIPFHAKIQALSISQTEDFDGLSIDDIDIEESYIKVKTVNEFPLDANVQVYFTDNAGTRLDSLFTNSAVVKAAAVDANGFSQGNSELTSNATIDRAKIDRINLADKIVITATVTTTNNGSVPVKFSVTDKITIAVGVHTRLRFPLN